MLFYIVNYNVIWGCIISALVAGGAVTLFFTLRKGGKKSADEMKPSDKKDMLIGLRDNAEMFSDLLEPLFLLASGKTARKDFIFDAWNAKVDEIEGYDSFKTVFKKKFGDVAAFKGKKKKYVKSANKLLKYVFKAGIEREDDTTVIADETTAEKYDVIGNTSLQAGEQYDVFVPYWEIETEVKSEEGVVSTVETILCKGAIR